MSLTKKLLIVVILWSGQKEDKYRRLIKKTSLFHKCILYTIKIAITYNKKHHVKSVILV